MKPTRATQFVIMDDFVDHPLIPSMREDARRIVDLANASYPNDVHTKGYVHRGVTDGSASAVRGLYHPSFEAPSFAEFYSSEEVLQFTKSWTGLEKEQLHFYPPHIFCNPNRHIDHKWTPGGGGGWVSAGSRLHAFFKVPVYVRGHLLCPARGSFTPP